MQKELFMLMDGGVDPNYFEIHILDHPKFTSFLKKFVMTVNGDDYNLDLEAILTVSHEGLSFNCLEPPGGGGIGGIGELPPGVSKSITIPKEMYKLKFNGDVRVLVVNLIDMMRILFNTRCLCGKKCGVAGGTYLYWNDYCYGINLHCCGMVASPGLRCGYVVQ